MSDFRNFFLCFSCILPLISGCTKDQTGKKLAGQDRDAFMENLHTLCGKAFAGRLASNDAVDSDFSDANMVMHVRDCEEGVIRIPFHVDDDHSRTWLITRVGRQLKLEHDHRHEDGKPDAVTLYGGVTNDDWEGMDARTPNKQSFPADAYTKELFEKEGLTASLENVWTVEVHPFGAIRGNNLNHSISALRES